MLKPRTKMLLCCRLFAVGNLIALAANLLLADAPPSGDTYVSSTFPRTNFGSGIALAVGSGTTSYVQFNLSGIPAGASISKATLRLYVDAVGSKGAFDVYQVNSAWNENTLIYNSLPLSLGPSATGGNPVSITSSNLNQFLLIDMTTLVQEWVNGSVPNNGVALILTTTTGAFSFDSKESLLTGNGPELEIVLAGGGTSGPPGPQGPTGPQGTTGTTGAQGPIGPAGPQGPIGPVGAQGPAGPQGPAGATGVQGPAGPIGPMGLPGPQGPQGNTGPQGPAGVGFNFRGPFDTSVAYAANDVASFNGSTYVARAATNPGDAAPDLNPNWSALALQGGSGSQGPAGPQGSMGATGSQGPAGPTGATGTQGPIGLAGPTGAQGPVGPAGPMGLPGAQGPQGGTGLQGPAGIGFNFRGPFDTGATYAANDVISFGGSSYVARAATNPGDAAPDTNPNWSLLAQQGAPGPQGDTGIQGPAGPQGQQGAIGPQGSIGPIGPLGPQGVQGPVGPQGPQGPVGPQGPQGLREQKYALQRWYRQDFAVNAAGQVLAFDGANIWVAKASANSVIKMSASDGTVIGTYPAGASPAAVLFDGANIWVSNQTASTVTKLRASDGTNLGSFNVGTTPVGLAFDGANIWVANNGSANVTKLQASDGTIMGTYPAGTSPLMMVFDGTYIWITNSGSGLSTVTRLLASDGTCPGTCHFPVGGTSLMGIAYDGAFLWIAFNNTGVVRFNPSTTQSVASFSSGTGAFGVTYDGTYIWVTNNTANTVSRFTTIGTSPQGVGGFTTGHGPSGIISDGTNLWVANITDNNVSRF